MNSSGLWQDIKTNPLILIAVIVLHFVLIVLLSINLISSEVPKYSAPAKETVKAVIVDAEKVEAEAKKLKLAEEKKKQKVLVQKNKVKKETEKARKKLEAEKKRLAEIKKKQAVEKKRLAAIKSKKETERKAAEAKAEKKRIEAEKQKVLAEQAEKRRLKEAEELKRQKEAAEVKRRQEEAAELKQKLEDEERFEAEAREQAQHNEMLNSLRMQYVKLIEQKVERNWLRPVTSTADMSCEVIVTQTSLGDVMSVGLQQCTNDLAFQRSIERAVRKASPLPPPPNPEVFDREIHFTFRPGS